MKKGSGPGLPTGTGNTIVQLLGAPVTSQSTGAATPYLPFGFWFANPTTLYVADEGYSNTDPSGNLLPDSYAGLEKWTLVGGTWTLAYTIQAGLNLDQAQNIPGYPVPTYPTGLRNITGYNNGDGTVTIYAITAQYSSFSGGEPDPTSLVGITDSLAAATLPANEQFLTIQNSGTQQVYRGVAYVPPAPGSTRQTQTINFPSVGSVTYGASPITLAATATSNWPIAYTVISGPATLSGNVLTITGAGSVTLQADQSGNTDYSAAASVQQSFTVAKATPSVTWTTPSPITYGTALSGAQLNATASVPGAFMYIPAAGAILGGGTQTLSLTFTPTDSADYSSVTTTVSLIVNPASQSISFTTAPPASAEYGRSFAVAATGGASGNPVVFTSAGSCSNSGATYTMTGSTGNCSVIADQAGNANYSAAPEVTATTAATLANGSVSVASSPNPSSYGQSVTFTATITSDTGMLKGRGAARRKPLDVTGTVTWSDSNGPLTCSESGTSTTTVTSGYPGAATCTTSTLAANPSDTITATYSGDSNHNGGSGTVSQEVDASNGNVSAVSSLNPSNYGQSVTFTATVSGDNGLARRRKGAKPMDVTGTVSWSSNTGCADSTVSGYPGTATCTTSSLTGGTDTVTASYSGDSNHNSGSASVSQVVKQLSQTIAFTTNAPASAAYNSSFTVAATGGASGNSVAFTSAGSCSNSGSTYTMTSGAGHCSVIANQVGNANYAAASQVTENVSATPASQTINVTVTAPATAANHFSFTVVASATSGLPITFTSSGACTNVHGTYTMNGRVNQVCKVSMYAPSSANYTSAPAVTETTTVAAPVRPTVSLTGAPATAVYGATFPVTASSNETEAAASIPVISSTTPSVCSVSGSVTSGTSVTATVTMLTGTGMCDLKAAWAANYAYTAATATAHATATKLTPVISFTGAPASASNGTSFTVTATSNESGSVSVPTITAMPAAVCSVGTVTSSGPGSYQASVTMLKATGMCTTKAAWATNSIYAPASATQETTAQH